MELLNDFIKNIESMTQEELLSEIEKAQLDSKDSETLDERSEKYERIY